MAETRVSVVIPAYNAQETISKTLSAVLAQDWPEPLDVIVIDDGSTDNTALKVKGFLSSVRYFYQDNAGPAAARNLGWKAARGGIVFFTDSDCIPRKDWIKKMMPHFKKADIAAVAGSYGIANPHNILARCIQQEIRYRHENLMQENTKVFGSYNVAVKKNALDETGGFNEEYRFASGEDNDLSYKLLGKGYRIRFEKEGLVDHHHPEVLKRYLFEQYRHGYWRAKMYLSHPHMSRGDEYTFWKDIIEVPLVGLFVFFLGYALLMGGKILILPFLVILLFIVLELFFSSIFCSNLLETLYFSSTMLLRAFSRTLGFCLGVFTFLPEKVLSRIKK